MKFSNLLFLLFPIIASSRILEPKSVNVSFLNGSWIQMYSSKYVQESTEIDWDCVTVDISVNPNNNNINITKSAILHDNKNLVTTHTRIYNAINGVDSILLLLSPILGTSSSIMPNLALKYINDNYIIITGMDYLTMYIIVRDYETFIHYNDDDALQLLKSFNYTTYYKYPNLSFSSSCLN
jgi:hypothetical protein